MIRKTTKDILAESFLELASDRRIDKMTVTMITDNCGMSQPTFYNHFRDKYDLIVWIYDRHMGEIAGRIGRDGYVWRDCLSDVAAYYCENRDFIVNAIKNTSGQDSFLEYIRKRNTAFMKAEVRKKLMTEYIPEEIMGCIRIYVYGTVQYMKDWLTGDMRQRPEQVAGIWERSLPEALKKYLCE